MAFYTTKNNTYCSVNNTLYLTQGGTTDTNVIRVIDCVTNAQIDVIISLSNEVLSKLIYNSSTNCMYYISFDGTYLLKVLDCNTNIEIASINIGYIGGSFPYSLVLNSALNIIYFQNYDGSDYNVSVFDCSTNTITIPNLINLSSEYYNIFTYNPYFETLNIGSQINSLIVINTTTLQTTTYTNVLQTLNGIIYNPLDGYYYLSGYNGLTPTIVRYKEGIVYGSGNSADTYFPKLIPNKSSIIYLGDGEYNLFNTKTLRNLGGGFLNIDTNNVNIYQVGNLYSFNYVNSLVYTFDKFFANLIEVSNLSAVSSSVIEYSVSETGGELNNTGLTISRPISNAYALSSVNYLNPMSVSNFSELIFTAYDPTLNSLHFMGYSLCNFSFTQNKWENLVEVINTSPLAMCLNTTNGYLYVCIQTSNTDNNQIAVLNAQTYELIELVNTQHSSSTYFSYDPIRNLIYSTTSNLGNNVLSVIDCFTNTEINVIDLNSLTGFGSTVGYGVIYVENNNSLYVNFISDTDNGLLVLDADTYTLITTIVELEVNQFAYSSVYSPIQNKIYIPLSQGYDIDIIDCATNISLESVTLTTISPYNPVYNYIDDKVYFIHEGSKIITVLDCATETTSEILSYYAGGINNSFNQGGIGFNNGVKKVNIQSDDKILVVGGFIDYDGTPANHIIRLNLDGSIDTSFITGTGFDYDVVDFSIQIDGKIICVGDFTSYNGTLANYIVRLNSDGSIDNTFVTGTGFNGSVNSISIQSDGKILLVGQFTDYNGELPIHYIIRLNSDGSVDNTFVQGTGFNVYPFVVLTQSDGKILVGGNLTSYNGTSASRIIRLNTDGSIDTSFITGTGFNSYLIKTISIQNDNKIIIGGGFTQYNGTFTSHIVRLNIDGSIDNTFVTGTGFDGDVITTKIQSDGKIFVGGAFTSYNGINANYISVLNTDGSFDTNYDFNIGSSNNVNSISLINNNNFYIGGSFTSYDGTSVGSICCIYATSYYSTPQTPPQSIVYNGNNNSIVLITDEVATLTAGYSYVYSFDCNTLAETIINKSVPYNNYPTVGQTTYSPINNNYYVLFIDNLYDCYLVVYSGSTNLEISRVLLSLQSLSTLEYCSYNNYVYIGGDVNNIVVFDCNTNTELASLPYGGAVGTIINITFNPVNNLLYCGGTTGSLIVFDVTTDLQLTTIPSISSNYFNVSSCVNNINNQIIYAISQFSSSNIIFFDCALETYVDLNIFSLYGLYSNFVIYNPINNLIYCTANNSKKQSFLLIIDPVTQTVIENISLNQLINGINDYVGFRLSLNTTENTILIASNGVYSGGNNGILILDCSTNNIVSTNSYKVGTSDFSLSSYSVNIASVFYNSNYNSFVAFHCVFENSQLNGIAISTFTKQNTYSNEAFIPIVESGVCNIVRYDCNINRVMETVYTLPAETPYVGKMVYNENNNYLYFVQYQTRIPFSGTKSIGVLDLTNNTLVTTLYPTLINDPNNSGGTINTSFNVGVGFNDGVESISIQNDNKVLVGGYFSNYNGTFASKITRLNSDGSIDTSFVTGTGFTSGRAVLSMNIQTDGKILVGGDFTDYNGTTANSIIRLNSDGSIDTSFVTGSGFSDVFDAKVESISIQYDGKILAVGTFTSYNGTSVNNIIRLNTDGSVDTSFVTGTGFDDTVLDIFIQTDGKILVGGYFSNYNGTFASRIIRLNTDGSIDNTFITGTGFTSGYVVDSIKVQTDGKILVGGNFLDYNGTTANRIIRLNNDGSIDTSFNTGTGFDSIVSYIAIQSDGKIICLGLFNNYNGTSVINIVKLNTDGSIDASFDTGTGFGNMASNCLSFYGDSILVGGSFFNYNGYSTQSLVSIYNVSIASSDLIDMVLNPFSNVIQIANTYSNGTTESGNVIVIDCNTNTISQYVPTGNGVEFLTYNSALNTIAYAGVQQGGVGNFYFGSLTGTSNFTIDGGSVNYDFFVQGLNNDPKKIEEIEIEMPQRYLVNPVNVQYKDANGISDLKPYLPNTEIDTFQKAPNRATIKFGDDYVMNLNTQIVDFKLPPLSETILVITYTELLKSDMLDMVVYEDERKAKYKINQSLDGKITAEKYWGAKKMPKELHLSSDWLTEMRKRFKKVEVIEYDQPKLAGGTAQTREVYQDLFGFSKQVKERHIGITKTPKFKKGVKVKLATKKQPIKPVAEDINVEQVFQDMLRVNAHEIPLEKIIPTEMPIDKKPIKPRPVEMTTEEVFQEMLSVNAHEIKLNRIKVPKIKGVKPIQVQLDDLSPVDVFNRSFEDYGSGYLIGVKTPCKEEESEDKYVYGVYYIKPIDDRFTAFRHSGDVPLKIELNSDWFNDLKRNFDDIQVIAIVKKKK